MFTLYRLTFASGKCYIGQTSRTMQIRIAQHRRRAANNSPLAVHAAWLKYGEPSVDVLAVFETREGINQAEIEAIRELGTLTPNGYNICVGGDVAPSKSKHTAAKIAAAALGRKYSDTSAWSQASKQLWSSDLYRAKVSDGLKASWDDERRAKVSARMREMWEKRRADGWSMPTEHREAIAARVVSKETRDKMSQSARARGKSPVSAETCSKLSAMMRQSWANPQFRANRIAAVKAGKLAKSGGQNRE